MSRFRAPLPLHSHDDQLSPFVLRNLQNLTIGSTSGYPFLRRRPDAGLFGNNRLELCHCILFEISIEFGNAQVAHFRGARLPEQAFDHVQQNQARVRFLRQGQRVVERSRRCAQKNPAGTESSCTAPAPVA